MDFTVFSRQSKKGIFIIFANKLRKRVTLLLYFIPLLIQKRNSEKLFTYILLFVIGYFVITITESIFQYIYFKFKVNEDSLLVKSGVFHKKELIIPFQKIVNVELKRSLIHQFVDATQLEIQTAGSNEKELLIEAISNRDAILLKRILLKGNNKENIGEKEQLDYLQKTSLKQLFAVAITENHLRSFGVILLFFFGLFEKFSKFIGKESSELVPLNNVPTSFYFWLYFFIIALVSSILVSFSKVFLKHYNLKTVLRNGAIEIKQGLINYRHSVIKTERIQYLNVVTNPLKKLLGIQSVYFYEVVSGRVKLKNINKTIGVTKSQLEKIVSIFYTKESFIFTDKFKNVHKYYIYKLFLKALVYLIALDLYLYVLLYLEILSTFMLIFNLSVCFVFLISAYIYYRKFSYNFNDSHIQVRKGLITSQCIYFDYYKIQQIKIRQTFFQKRRNIADLHLETASQKIKIPCIDYDKAIYMYNKILTTAEISTKKWM